MTILAVKDGIMAVDSLVVVDDTSVGTTQKWLYSKHDRTWLAGSGELSVVKKVMEQLADGSEYEGDAKTEFRIFALRPDGRVDCLEENGWANSEAPFHASGTGMDVAIGAMAAGVSAEQAAQIAIDHIVTCGGPIKVMLAGVAP